MRASTPARSSAIRSASRPTARSAARASSASTWTACGGRPARARVPAWRESRAAVVEEDSNMEEVSVAGVAYDRDEAKLTILRVPDRPGVAARLFGPIARANIIVDMIIQNASADGTTDLTFTVARGDYAKARALVDAT